MRKFLTFVLFLCLMLATTGCNIPDVVVSTIVSGGNEIATKVAKALTETAVSGGAVGTPAPGEPYPRWTDRLWLRPSTSARSRPIRSCPPPRCRTCGWRSSPAAARGWSLPRLRPINSPPKPAWIQSISRMTARWSPTSGIIPTTSRPNCAW
jgi:hypothetical protein